MKRYPTLIAALMMSSLSQVIGEPDHQLRAFLEITSVSTKAKIDEPSSYFEVFVFKKGKEEARLPTSVSSNPAHREIEVCLMFNNKGMVKFIGEGSTSDLSDQVDWTEVLKPTGGKGWQTGTTDKPLGMIDGFKVLAVVQGEQLDSGSSKYKIQSDLDIDESTRRAIQNAESCVVIGFKSGTEEEIGKTMSDAIEANKKRQNKSEMATPRKPSD